MTDKELKKLNRSELLELMLEQSRGIDRLQAELEETREALQERNLKIESCGSIAEAAAEVNSLFHAAQRAADMYLLNVQRICAEKAEEAGKTEEWQNVLRGVDPAKKKAAADQDKAKEAAAAVKTAKDENAVKDEKAVKDEEAAKGEDTVKDEEAADERQDS